MEHLDFGILDPHACGSEHSTGLDCHDLHIHDGFGIEPTQGVQQQLDQGLHQQLTVAYVAQGMDPAQAAQQAQLQAPLLEPFLF